MGKSETGSCWLKSGGSGRAMTSPKAFGDPLSHLLIFFYFFCYTVACRDLQFPNQGPNPRPCSGSRMPLTTGPPLWTPLLTF